MGQRLFAGDREQAFVMPPDVREGVAGKHPAGVLVSAGGGVKLDAVYAGFWIDGGSRPPYDPAMMVALLLYGSAGINRHGEGDGRALHRRSSDPRWPRVMRRRSRGRRRSVGRGTCGLGY